MKVLLISDSAMNINSGGFSQTLYNIFSFVQPEDLLLITSLNAYNEAHPSPPFDSRVLTYDLEIIPVQRNILGRFVNTFITQFNYSINSTLRRFKRIQKAIKKFDADIVIVAPNGAECIFMYEQLKKAFSRQKTIPYFMDDWLCQSKLRWIGGNIHSLAKSLLANNTAWMMISESLGNILTERYSVKPLKLLTIHNPVDIQNLVLHEPTSKKKAYTIAYAGSLWQMHFRCLFNCC